MWNGNLCGQYSPWGNQTIGTASYGEAGALAGLTYDNYSESRTYDSLLQLTRATVSGVMDMHYTYTAGQNNGRITKSTDNGVPSGPGRWWCTPTTR